MCSCAAHRESRPCSIHSVYTRVVRRLCSGALLATHPNAWHLCADGWWCACERLLKMEPCFERDNKAQLTNGHDGGVNGLMCLLLSPGGLLVDYLGKKSSARIFDSTFVAHWEANTSSTFPICSPNERATVECCSAMQPLAVHFHTNKIGKQTRNVFYCAWN